MIPHGRLGRLRVPVADRVQDAPMFGPRLFGPSGPGTYPHDAFLQGTADHRQEIDDWLQANPDHVFKPVPASYWNLSAAVYAYVFAGLARLGVDAAGESEITSRPGFFR